MKKLFVFALSAAVAFLAANVVASAQYLPGSLNHHRGSLVDEQGHVLTNQEVLNLIGEEDYNKTYTGAVKQYKSGNALLITGIATGGAGLVGTIAGAIATDYGLRTNHITYERDNKGKITKINADTKGTLAVVGFAAGISLLTAGITCLSVGIPLKVIGTKRLDWIADDYNKDAAATIRFGAGQYGTGIVMTF